LFSPVSVLTGLLKKTTDQIFTKFYEMVGHNPGTNQSHSE